MRKISSISPFLIRNLLSRTLILTSNLLIFKIMVGSTLEQVLGNKTMERQVGKTHTLSCHHRSKCLCISSPRLLSEFIEAQQNSFVKLRPIRFQFIYHMQVLPRRARRGTAVSVLFQGETRVEIHISQEPNWDWCLNRSNSRLS